MNLPSETVALEQLIAQRGDKTAVIDQLLRTVVVVPLDLITEGETGVAPVTINKDGVDSVVIFTRAEDAEEFRSRPSYAATMPATGLILRMPDGVGLLLFTPAGNAALEPSLLNAIRADLRERATSDGSAD